MLNHISEPEKTSIRAILKGNDVYWDRFRAKMANLPYRSFQVIEFDDNRWLVGATRDIIMTDVSSRRGGQYDIGSYGVFISIDAFIKSRCDEVHLIPERIPDAMNRHPHHIAHLGEDPHALRADPHTCLAGFTVIFSNLYSLIDIAEIYRTWYIFLSRYNPLSPLAGRHSGMIFLGRPK